jgi:hypothetical protein
VAGAGIVLAACGGGGSGGSTATTRPGNGGTQGGNDDGFVVVRFFPDGVQPPGRQRLPVGLASSDGALIDDGPESITADVVDGTGAVVASGVTAARHGRGLPRPYYPFFTELAAPGIYTLSVAAGDRKVPVAFSVNDPGQIVIPEVGGQLVAVDTPTVDDNRGVDPICTAEAVCPLHEQTLTEAMATGKPVAFLIATPAYCQTAACGPVLDVLLAERARLGDGIAMVHAEVYINDEPGPDTVSPAVKAYELGFEPVLYRAGADGVITERLDSIFDGDEVGAALDRLLA